MNIYTLSTFKKSMAITALTFIASTCNYADNPPQLQAQANQPQGNGQGNAQGNYAAPQPAPYPYYPIAPTYMPQEDVDPGEKEADRIYRENEQSRPL